MIRLQKYTVFMKMQLLDNKVLLQELLCEKL